MLIAANRVYSRRRRRYSLQQAYLLANAPGLIGARVAATSNSRELADASHFAATIPCVLLQCDNAVAPLFCSCTGNVYASADGLTRGLQKLVLSRSLHCARGCNFSEEYDYIASVALTQVAK